MSDAAPNEEKPSRLMRGIRYSLEPDCDPEVADFIVSTLPWLLMEDAIRFYDDHVPSLTRSELALLHCNDRFFLLTKTCGRKDLEHPWLYARCREVELNPDGYLDLWARDHRKSTIITFGGTIQEVLINPEVTIGIFAGTNKIARPFLEQIKNELQHNEILKEAHPDVLYSNPQTQSPSWSIQKGITVKRKTNPKEQTVEAYGLIDGMPTGRHFQVLVYDDLINEELAENPDMVEKATRRWEMSDNLGSVGRVTRRWHIGTRYAFGDTYGEILGRGLLIPRLYPATHNGKVDGNPVFLTDAEWTLKKRTQSRTLNAQLLQNPLAGKEQMFRVEMFRAFDVRPSSLNIYIMGDPSKGKSATSDRTAIAVVAVDRQGHKYLVDGYCHHMKLSERWKCLKNLFRKWNGANGVQMVKVGWEQYGLVTDIEYFKERMKIEKDLSFEVHELNWANDSKTQSKADRVERLEPDFRDGHFWLPASVNVNGVGECMWSIDMEKSTVETRAKVAQTKRQKRMIAEHQAWRIQKPIVRADNDGDVYDLTRILIDEMMLFPFGGRDDLVDAVSRIYDLSPLPAIDNWSGFQVEPSEVEYED